MEQNYIDLINEQTQTIKTLKALVERQQQEIDSIYRPNNRQPANLNQKFIIYGGGSHACEMHSNLLEQRIKHQNIGFYDANPNQSWAFNKRGFEVKHVDQLDYNLAIEQGILIILAIGNPATRGKIASQIEKTHGITANRFGNSFHPSAIVPDSVEIGRGAMVLQGASIGAQAQIGKQFFGNTRCIIGHDNVVGDNVSLYTGATLAGHVEVGTQL
jgi:UDP-3-O-[3-hydroxymyristoyl] glucosamine N-acyltransferase